MDRDAIERRDFPVGRRGYDQTAVDAHLRQVADELEAMRGRAAAPARAPLSAGTSDQVRQILEAAERSAAQLREDAGREASDHVGRVGEAADAMLAQLDALERELGTLLGALRASGERLSEGLARLQAEVGEVGGLAPDPVEPAAPEPVEPAAPEEDFAAAAPAPAAPAPAAPRPRRRKPAAAPAPAPARNVALSGTPREETAAYLAEHFELSDPEALLDDVYARAGG
jgi:DivIVA domain-containing protein